MDVVDSEENSGDLDEDSSIDRDNGPRRLRDEQLRAFGSAYQTVIVILQDLVSFVRSSIIFKCCMYV